jgi:hypothetical protein
MYYLPLYHEKMYRLLEVTQFATAARVNYPFSLSLLTDSVKEP